MPERRALTPFRAKGHNHADCVDEALAAAEDLCRRRGLRLTPRRRRVLELIWSRHEPVRAYDILDRLRAEHGGAAPPMVYRALDFLLENGLIHRVESLNAYVGCSAPLTPHIGQFLICRHCSAIIEIDDSAIRRAVARKAKSIGFRVDRQTVEISGLCPHCRERHGEADGAS